MGPGTFQQPDEEQLALLRLKLTPALGNRSILRLLDRFGSATRAVSAGAEELSKIPGLRKEARDALLRNITIRPPVDEWRRLEELGAWMLRLGFQGYPENLKLIDNPPVVLFGKGRLEPRDLISIAVVGSRSASPAGLMFTEKLCMELAQAGVTIVSGLAVGIDAAAHRGALKVGGRTLAVLGCGLDVAYPRSNLRLRKQISKNGAVLTEYVLGTAPLARNFPPRNRIISGLALGVVVVEATERSGSLITARLALEQGREVFAVPGMAGWKRSAGPNRLLRQGAKLVENAEDVLEEIRPLIRSGLKPSLAGEKIRKGGPENLSEDEERVLRLLEYGPRHIDELSRELDWPISRLGALLAELEIKGLVQRVSGNYMISD